VFFDFVRVATRVDATGTMEVGIKDACPAKLGVTIVLDHTTVPLLVE
jgi:hypothetical protein